MKTFLPTLFQIVYLLCTYITRHADRLRSNLPDEDARTKFDALHDACTAFLLLRDVILPPSE